MKQKKKIKTIADWYIWRTNLSNKMKLNWKKRRRSEK